jgi:membrane associated rhomboid family serine protease
VLQAPGYREEVAYSRADVVTAGGPTRPLVAAQVIAVFVGLLYVVELVDTMLGNQLDAAGVRPRELEGLDGILFAPALHGGWGHLMANTVPLLVFGFLILLSGIGRWVAVTAVVWVVGGVGTWLTGGEQTIHLGASVLAFGWLVYLLVRGFFSRSASQVALGVILLFLYGGVLWGVLPGQPGVSWQGHLFGALGGVWAAWWFGGRDRELARRLAPRSW